MTYYLIMMSQTAFTGALKLAGNPNSDMARVGKFLQESGATLDAFASDLSDYAGRTNQSATPLKDFTTDAWFNLVSAAKKWGGIFQKQILSDPNITKKLSEDQKKKLGIKASLERYPTVARILGS
jgi:hypothetical protein